MDNLELWQKVCTTDPAITKRAKVGGNSITVIDPQFQRKAATEQFGPFGIGWGVTEEKWSYIDVGDTKLCHYTAQFWYVLNDKRGEFPINANVKVAYKTQGQNSYLKVDDEFAKKVQTNAITKGLSALGFNSDVFEGKFDDNKYVQEQRAAHANPTPPASRQQSQNTIPELTLDDRFKMARDKLGDDTCTDILVDKFSLTLDDWGEATDDMKAKIIAEFRKEAQK